jgi:hypothetical protein
VAFAERRRESDREGAKSAKEPRKAGTVLPRRDLSLSEGPDVFGMERVQRLKFRV